MKKFVAPAIEFVCPLPPKMQNFGKLSDFLKQGKINSEFPIDQKKMSDIHGFTGVKHAIARYNFVDLKTACEDFYENLSVEYKKESKILNISVSLKTLLPIIMKMDNFVNETYGSLDFFSRGLDEIFGTHMEINSNFKRICEAIKSIKKRDELIEKILTFYQSDGYIYLHALRIRTIHWFPLAIQIRNKKLLLPDHPFEDVIDPETQEGFEIVSKSEELLYHTLGFIDDACDSIGKILFKGW